MMGLFALMGLVVTVTYFPALAGHKVAGIMYAMFFRAMILSLFAEFIFRSLASSARTL
jgi:hypothetical protein